MACKFCRENGHGYAKCPTLDFTEDNAATIIMDPYAVEFLASLRKEFEYAETDLQTKIQKMYDFIKSDVSRDIDFYRSECPEIILYLGLAQDDPDQTYFDGFCED